MRAQELRLQKVLKLVGAGITAFGRMVQGAPLSNTQQDMLALLCNAHFEINCLWKVAIKQTLNPRFAALCRSSNVQTPNLLFGEDLAKQVKVPG